MKTAAKAKLRALRDELLQAEAEAEDEGAQTEREHGDPDVPLEADDPLREPTHPDSTPDGDSFQ